MLICFLSIFQSTLPQGERQTAHCTVHTSADFNPRSHKGSDDEEKLKSLLETLISIHAPTRGATGSRAGHDPRAPISIHAPTRGATGLPDGLKTAMEFQSTLPQGERQHTLSFTDHTSIFQSTLPQGERPVSA